MPGVDFNVLRSEISMEQVLNQLGLQPTGRTDQQLYGYCPIHESSSTRSQPFSVILTSGRYYCHKCHSDGNQFELWAAVKNLSVYDAAIDLCHARTTRSPLAAPMVITSQKMAQRRGHRYSEP